MRLLFATGRQYWPDRLGGAGNSMHALLASCRRLGHQCEAVAMLPKNRWRTAFQCVRRVTGRTLDSWPDRRTGYVSYKALEWTFLDVFVRRLTTFRPDVVVTQLEQSESLAQAALERRIPTVMRVCDAEFKHYTGALRDERMKLVSNSRFVAEALQAGYGANSTVLYPMVDLQGYRASPWAPELITLVNPATEKGVDLAFDVARLMPRQRFLFQEGWPLEPDAAARLHAGIAECPNVVLGRRTRRMRDVYQRTAILIVPSRWEEAFGRVVLEAQVNGIPVVARDVGGLGEALGDGGMLMPATASAEAWAESLARLLQDSTLYRRLSDRARQNVQREELQPEVIVDRFLQLARDLVSQPTMASAD